MFLGKVYGFIKNNFGQYDLEKLWEEKGKEYSINIDKLKHCLYLPVWSSDDNHFKDLRPIDVLEGRKYQHKYRIDNADLSYPLCVINLFSIILIVDGHHRLCKAIIENVKKVKVKQVNLFKVFSIPLIKEYRSLRKISKKD
jgi:hypothetical protein